MKPIVISIFVTFLGSLASGQTIPDACQDDKTLQDCWSHFVPVAMPAPPAPTNPASPPPAATPPTSAPAAAADASATRTSSATEMTKTTMTTAALSPTGVDTSGVNLGTTARKLTNLVDLAALLADSDEDGVLTFDLNFLLPFQQAKDNNFQLQAVVNTEPEVWKPLEMALPEDQRTMLSEQLGQSVGDFDDLKLELTYRPVGPRIGRGFKQYRDRFSSLFRELEQTASDTVSTQAITALPTLIMGLTADVQGLTVTQNTTFAEIPSQQRDTFRTTLIASAKEVGAYQDVLRKGVKHYQLNQFAALVNNQPEFQGSLRVAVRDNVTGPDETTLRVNYEYGFVNLNRFFGGKWRQPLGAPCLDSTSADSRRSALDGGKAQDCLSAFLAYVGDPKRKQQLERGDRVSVSLEYTDIDSLEVPLPDGLDPIMLPSAEKLKISAGYGRLLEVDDSGMPLSRIDFMASYEDISDDPSRQDRALASLTYTRQIGGLAVPLGVVWASKAEFLPEVDEQISAHLGIRFSLGDKP